MSKPVIIAIAFVFFLGSGFGLVLPKYQKLSDLNAAIKTKELELQSRKDYFVQIQGISEELEKYDLALAKIASALPADPAPAALFDFLQETSSQSGLVLEEISLKGIASPQTAKTKDILVDLQAAGTYSAFKDFLTNLEKSARLIEVEKISFSTPEDAGDPFSFGLEIKTHSY